MSQYVSPPKLDVKQAGLTALQLAGQDLLLNYERLMLETKGKGAENALFWSVRSELKTDQLGLPQVWIHLTVDVSLPLTCQRCLGPVDERIQIERDFRFVETEVQAELEDDESLEDVLVASQDFDLAGLIEDEILLDLPLVPRHEVCPVDVKLAVADADFEQQQEKPHPFAALASLKNSSKQ